MTDLLTQWIQQRIDNHDLQHIDTRDGVTIYRATRPLYPECAPVVESTGGKPE